MPYWASGGTARVQAGEADQWFVPYNHEPGQRRCVMWCHFAGVTYHTSLVARAIAAALGCVWMNCELGGPTTWGSDTALARVTTAWTYAKNNLGVKTDKYLLWGESMGGQLAILKALADASNVAAVGVGIPITDPQWTHDNVAGSTPSIAAVYGGPTVPDAKQPKLQGAAFAATGVPCQVWYSTSDTHTPTASTETFIADAGAQSQSLGAIGHSTSTLDADQALQFLNDYV